MKKLKELELIRTFLIPKSYMHLDKWKDFNTDPVFNHAFEKKYFSKQSIEGVSYRQINHWTEQGLIDDTRTKDSKWRKFSLIDLVWIHIIRELKEFGFPNNKIKIVKETILDKKEPVLKFYIYLVYRRKEKRVDLFVLNTGK
ncbi:MAG: MerR family transcriptional regulator, partial [Nanoarchaeota archaeon]|nr:MerR family transcriptional regulator [Nanoarchaeota archaeon]